MQAIKVSGAEPHAEVLIPDYVARTAEHFAVPPRQIRREGMFDDFGIRLRFDEPTQYQLYDENLKLAQQPRALLAEYGAVIFENAYLADEYRTEGQRNIFPNMGFHLDRVAGFDNRISLFLRDPFDKDQRHPRKSSTLIVPYEVIRLQSIKEGQTFKAGQSRVDLFGNQRIRPLLDQLLLHQSWTAPAGTGEMCLIDNRCVYHASYYRMQKQRGYPIGVRYLY